MCIFCEIAAGNIPSAKVFENDKILAFRDINPQAPVHVLVIPKEHIPSADGINRENSGIISEIFENIPLIASSEGLKNGYRIGSRIIDRMNAAALSASPGLRKSLKRRLPGTRIIEFAGIASGVHTATDEAMRTAITTARGSAPRVLAMLHPIGQNSAQVAVLLITCVRHHTVSQRTAISSIGP